MSPAEHRRAGELFEQLRELPENELASALDTACAGNDGLRAEVSRLLGADRAADADLFLERRAIEDAALLLGRTIAPGTKLGPFEITAMLGSGGMGEVYRARDTQLGREVAVKVLASALGRDPEYMSRFEREAQVLASLNHPNIATVYGIEQRALIMELVEGKDLGGPLPLDEAIPIARQIAVGLEAAHERGIVHRDLKPSNVKVTREGVVKLLDFGLAKSSVVFVVSPEGARKVSPLPAATEPGMILGTAAYMSPEQARGKPVDKRTDIWSFGVVLYEMLTGQQLFARETVTDTLVAVLKDNPDFNELPPDTPPHIRRLLERCLRKDSATRLRDIGEARVMLDEPNLVSAPPAPMPGSRSRIPWVVAAVAIAALLVAMLLLRRSANDALTLRLSVMPPATTSFWEVSVPALSPNGDRLAFAAGTRGNTRLWIRDLRTVTARPLPGTEGAFDPFWSQDGRFLGFFVPGKLKKVDVEGGPPLTVCDAADGRGGSWSRDDIIVFTPSYGAALFRVPAGGGVATAVTTLDEAAGETSHRFPWFLPDGRHFLYTARSEKPDKTAIYAGDLDSQDRRLLLATSSNAVYSPPGLLLFMREKTVMAQKFDAGRLRTTAEPFPVAEQVDYIPGSNQGEFAVSQTGVLAYYSGGGSLNSQLTWLDRDGKALGTVGPPGVMQGPAISPDGATIAVDRLDARLGTYDIWLHDISRGTESRFTFDPSNDMFPVWSPDGSHILFSSTRSGKYGLYQKSAAGTGAEELLYETTGVTLPTDWARGPFIVFFNTGSKTLDDLWVLPLSGDRKVFPFLKTEFSEAQGKLSPDGRWLAYQSNESGSYRIYVQTFPGKEGKWQVSADVGTRPVWRRDGKELFYVAGDGKMMALDVRSNDKFEHGIPKALFEARIPPTGLFDVTSDGKRFLMLNGTEQEGSAPMAVVVVNWLADTKR
ncbi:MAG TPA: protein kinase [Bryobacteraceae bacterium]|nr:protein kinase [Bryobacteraceae bacterium]